MGVTPVSGFQMRRVPSFMVSHNSSCPGRHSQPMMLLEALSSIFCISDVTQLNSVMWVTPEPNQCPSGEAK